MGDNMSRESQNEIINAISDEIITNMRCLATEQYNPGMDPDEMDHNLETYEQKIKSLRQIRNDLEEIFTGAIIKKD